MPCPFTHSLEKAALSRLPLPPLRIRGLGFCLLPCVRSRKGTYTYPNVTQTDCPLFTYAITISQANHHTPWTQLAGVYLRHAEPRSESERDIDTDVSKEETRVGRALGMSLTVAAEGISKGLEVGAFFVQFLQWWQVLCHKVNQRWRECT